MAKIQKIDLLPNGKLKIKSVCLQPKKCKTMMKMYKWFFSAGLLLLILLTASCSSQCECTLYENGEIVSTSTEKAQGQSCESFSNVTETPYGKMGLECVKKK